MLLTLLSKEGLGPQAAIAWAARGWTAEGRDVAVLAEAERDVNALSEAGVATVGFFDDAFPEALRVIPGPPAVVYVRGKLPKPEQPSLAVIGTREPTRFGITAAEALVAAAAERGTVIVSGLALGIDAIAHHMALAHGAPTVAILGSGLDRITPRRHLQLAERIVDEGGALLSEQPFGVGPAPETLVARNRLQSGLADSLLICQSGLRGGSMHTVRFAAEQGKPIWAPVPRSGDGANAGLATLLSEPSSRLPALLPAWRGRRSLAGLGKKPLARPVKFAELDAWADTVSKETTAAQARLF